MRVKIQSLLVASGILFGCLFASIILAGGPAFEVDYYNGFIISTDVSEGTFLLSVSCTQLDEWSSVCAESNPSRWQLWHRFTNLFRDPLNINVVIEGTTEIQSYDSNIPADFSGLQTDTFVAIKGDLSRKSLFGFGRRTIIAKEVIVPLINSWSGRLLSIDGDGRAKDVKMLNLKSEFGSDIKVLTTKSTVISNQDGKRMSIKNLSLNEDILEAWGRRYNIDWYEGEKKIRKVEVIAEKIILLGKTIGEGEEVIDGLFCREGLTRIEIIETREVPSEREGEPPVTIEKQKFYCTKCGNGVCEEPEAGYNCPEDCAEISLRAGDNFSFFVIPNKESFDLNKKTFMGDIRIKDVVIFAGVKFVASENTQIFRAMAGDEDLTGPYRDYFNFLELQDMSGVTSSYGATRPFVVKIIGKVLGSEKGKIVVEVNKIARYVQ